MLHITFTEKLLTCPKGKFFFCMDKWKPELKYCHLEFSTLNVSKAILSMPCLPSLDLEHHSLQHKDTHCKCGQGSDEALKKSPSLRATGWEYSATAPPSVP